MYITVTLGKPPTVVVGSSVVVGVSLVVVDSVSIEDSVIKQYIHLRQFYWGIILLLEVIISDSNVKLCCLHGESKSIYIGQFLTQKAKKLFYLAREFKYKNAYEFCWTAHRKIFLRKFAGAQSHRIDSESDLNHFSPAPPKL
ncbi:unnamed protein product [Euphydryas editha]|uniref:FP protein C-terminal domain-containing protein n=1 Tax=Euphydryas editha TaxID=104508 RepID=A0AAU9TIN9_EUPED|nr:unnamed protein product [Euphydryas editha]